MHFEDNWNQRDVDKFRKKHSRPCAVCTAHRLSGCQFPHIFEQSFLFVKFTWFASCHRRCFCFVKIKCKLINDCIHSTRLISGLIWTSRLTVVIFAVEFLVLDNWFEIFRTKIVLFSHLKGILKSFFLNETQKFSRSTPDSDKKVSLCREAAHVMQYTFRHKAQAPKYFIYEIRLLWPVTIKSNENKVERIRVCRKTEKQKCGPIVDICW